MIIPLFLYNTGLFLYGAALRIASLFHTKARLFVRGRKDIFDKIEQSLAGDTRKKIWVHCASLGEFEQGRPVIEQIREQYPDKTILLTFFSPSGYEVKKDYKYADHIFYLPLDSKRNAERMICLVQPELVLFVKYEFWYHYLKTLHTKHIPVVLFSAIFQQRHPFFKWYGGLYRKMLGYYSQIFVQDQESALLLNSIKVTGVQVAGDTRFDRAAKVRENNSAFPSIEAFKGTHNLVIAGSTWPEDEKLLQQAFEQLPPDYKLLIAPHETHTAHIEQIQALFPGQYCLWDAQEELLREKRVCIVNTVGYLSYLYRYADIVWIGGGFTRSGIHNIIEPAVYGLPICFGSNYDRYREATDMLAHAAAHSVKDAREFLSWINNKNALLHTGSNAKKYVESQLGATKKIVGYLAEKCFSSVEKKL